MPVSREGDRRPRGEALLTTTMPAMAAAATRDPDQPSRLLAAVDGGDHLHPSAAGYRIMADAVDLALFAEPRVGR